MIEIDPILEILTRDSDSERHDGDVELVRHLAVGNLFSHRGGQPQSAVSDDVDLRHGTSQTNVRNSSRS
jgi:hypothetical protein